VGHGHRKLQKHPNKMTIVDELSTGGLGLYSWDPVSCTWRLFRQVPTEARGKVGMWQGRFEGSLGIFDGGGSMPGAKPEPRLRIMLTREDHDHFVEQLFDLENGRDRLRERRRHQRIE